MQKDQCLYTSQETQWEHFYQYQITTREIHLNRVCKLQSKRFPVDILMHITKLINRKIREELIVPPLPETGTETGT